jgi:hypothetical protein
MQFYKNPFYLYIISFTLIILFYQLGWSLMYPNLSAGLMIFFIGTFLVSLYLGAVIDKYKTIQFNKVGESLNARGIILFLYFLFLLEFINNRGIPLFLVFSDSSYQYDEFGIKTLHPILATFTSFYSVYMFHVFLSTRYKRYLIYLALLLILPILYYDRGAFIIVLTSILFVYLMSVKRIRIKVIGIILISVFLLFYLFGILGNYRVSRTPSNDYFLEISKASDKFIESKIPKEFMWSYIYISSPLANLQSNIDKDAHQKFQIKNFIITELLPDFLSKRIAPKLNAERAELKNISRFLTVGTVYARSFVLLGWFGIMLMFIFNSALVFLYIILLRKNNIYYVTGIAILCTFVIYNTFTNMIYFSGVSFQLVYPLILPLFVFKKKKAEALE